MIEKVAKLTEVFGDLQTPLTSSLKKVEILPERSHTEVAL